MVGEKADDAKVTVRFEIPEKEFEDSIAEDDQIDVLGDAEELPVEGATAGFVFTVITVMAAITFLTLAQRVIRFALIKDSNGVLVDCREKPPVVTVLSEVPQGTILVVHPDGSFEKFIGADAVPDDLVPAFEKAMSLTGTG